MTQHISEPDRTDDTVLPPDMSVLIVCLSIRHGGVDVRVTQTAQELSRRGVRLGVAVISESVLHRALLAQGIVCHPLRRHRGSPLIVADLVRLARRNHLTVIDAHNSQSQIWAALAALWVGIPGRVATTHSNYREDHPQRWRQKLHEVALHLCGAAGFSFLAVSRSVSRYLAETLHVPLRRITLSRNGIAALPDPPPVPCDLAAEAGWPTDALILGMIGRLDPRKGHRLAIVALHSLLQAGLSNLRLFIAGTGREEPRLRALIAELDLGAHVHLAGFRRDVPSVLADLDLFLLPSFSEGLPYSVLEAARQAVPTLASRLEGTEDCFVDEKTIFFVPPGDQEALTDRLRAVVRSPEMLRQVGANAQQMAENDLELQKMIDETLRVYCLSANRS